MDIKTIQEELHVLDNETAESKTLVLYNDDYHTFEFVIESLIEVCKHNLQQAEQCALITHNTGKCDIKKGDYDKLKPMRDALSDRDLRVSID